MFQYRISRKMFPLQAVTNKLCIIFPESFRNYNLDFWFKTPISAHFFHRLMKSKTAITFTTMAIAAIASLFASAPITGNQQALALVVVHGHAGYYHGHVGYHHVYYGHYYGPYYHHLYYGHYYGPYYHHFYYGHYYGPYYHHLYYGHYGHYGPYY
jgi:hypothetical protein